MKIKPIISRFTVYQYMTAFLIILSLASAAFYGFGLSSLIPVLIAVFTTTALDLFIEYVKNQRFLSIIENPFGIYRDFKSKEWIFPQSALISGLFIGGLLTQNLPWHIYVIVGAIAILSKHLIKLNQRHVFNPANFGVLLVSVTFGAAHTWWISSPLVLVIAFGIFILWRLKRIDLGLSFVAAYFALVFLINLSSPVTCGMMNMECHMQPSPLTETYYEIINSGVIYFFAMFMLIEPKTNPAARKQRIVYGVLVAVLFSVFHYFVPRHDLPLALAVGNIFVLLLNRLKFEFKKESKPSISETLKVENY